MSQQQTLQSCHSAQRGCRWGPSLTVSSRLNFWCARMPEGRVAGAETAGGGELRAGVALGL